MAARRLLAVMLIFLAISTVLAVLAPPPTENEAETTTTTAVTGRDSEPEPRGRLLTRGVHIRRTADGLIARPPRVEVRRGDQLVLTVAVERPLELQIEGLGETATAVPDARARFDLFISEAGRNFLANAGTGRRLAVIVARRPKASAGGRSRTDTETRRRSPG